MGENIELRVGRRSRDGAVGLSTYIPQVLTLRVTNGSERSSAVQLTMEQVGELRRALAEVEGTMAQERVAMGAWDGTERRRIEA